MGPAWFQSMPNKTKTTLISILILSISAPVDVNVLPGREGEREVGRKVGRGGGGFRKLKCRLLPYLRGSLSYSNQALDLPGRCVLAAPRLTQEKWAGGALSAAV